ncbi:MAG: glycosyltransferase [Syntrophothermus sp.]
MKYSIIIPTLNEEKLLPGLLDQIDDLELKKRFDYEIIISDGGSIDKTTNLIQGRVDKIKLNNESIKQNIAIGRNEGSAYASGEILIFINADIKFDNPEKFFLYVEDKFYFSDFSAMTCNVKIFPEEEILLDKIYHYCYNGYFSFLNNIGLGMGRGECQIIRKDVFNKLNGYSTSLAAGEDFDLFRRVQKVGKVLFSKDLYIYESPRRFRKFGYAKVTLSWIKNGFSVFFKNKSLSKEWEQVR